MGAGAGVRVHGRRRVVRDVHDPRGTGRKTGWRKNMDSADTQKVKSISLANRRVDPLIGTVMVGKYRIIEILGRGGMGVVYKAKHELMGRMVAIKMLLPTLVSDDVQVARFQREARAASRMNHPNIIGLHDFGVTEDGLPYIVMDFLEGRSLADVIKEFGQVGISRTVHIFVQICDALDHAHKLGIIHRDLKPGNVMLVANDQDLDFVKVVDFGIAKLIESVDEDAQRLTSTGEIFGSPVYMSPEQCGGGVLDARSDVYALGCVLYETLTGKLPFAGKTIMETITRQLQFDPPSFSVCRPDLYIPEWLENAAFTAVQKDPTKRYQSMEEMRNALLQGYSQFSSVTSTSSTTRALNGALTSRISSSIKVAAVPDPPKPKINPYVIGGVALLVGLACGGAFTLFGHNGGTTNAISSPPSKGASASTTSATTHSLDQPITKAADTATIKKSTTNSAAEPAINRVTAEPAKTQGDQPLSTASGGRQTHTARPSSIIATPSSIIATPPSIIATHKSHSKPTTKAKLAQEDTDQVVATPHAHHSHLKLSGDQWLYQERVDTEHYGDATPLPMSSQ